MQRLYYVSYFLNYKFSKMSKAQKTTNASELNANANTALQTNDFATMDNILSQVETAEETAFEEISSEYLELGEGETVAVFYAGKISKTSIDGKDVEVAELLGKGNKRFIYGSAVLINNLKRYNGDLPVILRITHKGFVKNAKGKYADLKIEMLKPGK